MKKSKKKYNIIRPQYDIELLQILVRSSEAQMESFCGLFRVWWFVSFMFTSGELQTNSKRITHNK